MLELNSVLFDLDGTLVDPREALKMNWNISLKKMKLPLLDDEIIEQSVGEIIQTTFQNHFPQYKNRLEEFVENFRETYKSIPSEYFILIDGVVDTLYRLKENGFALGIVANKEGTVINYVLESIGLSKFFPKEVITSMDDGCKPKPSSELVENAIKRMKIEKNYTAMVGDHVYDVIAGNDAGVKTIAVLSGTSKLEDFEKYNPTLIIPSVKDIPMYIKKI